MNKLKILIENFIEKILLIYKSTKNLDEKMNEINDLLNSIIDYCIKKNIYFFINNNIKYTIIGILFREYLIKFIKDIINFNNKTIIDYIENNNDNNDDYDNFSSINSLLLNKYKKQENINNKVSFRDNISLITDNTNNTNNNDNNDNKNNKKYNVTHVKLPDDPSNLSLNYKSSLYIIILLDQNELIENSENSRNSENSENSNTNLFLQNFIDKLEDLCKELCNANDKKNFTKFFAS